MIKNMPNLKKAQQRTKNKVDIVEDSLYIPAMVENIGVNKYYHIVTYGCQANERDTETINGILEVLGYKHTDDLDEASIILLNTCAIRENAEQKVFGKIGAIKNMKQEKPELIFGICGCMPQEEETVNEILKKYHHIDLVFGTHNINSLPTLLMEAMQEKETIVDVLSQEGAVFEDLPTRRDNKIKAWVNIMYGCDKFCTYCIVPYTRGKERSRDINHILKEIQELKDEGYQEITLLGQNVNAYGKDLTSEYDFATLLEKTALIGIPRIRFMTSHPWDFSDRMIDVIAKYDNIMPFIHLPVQSGNDDILKIMNRKYTVNDYINIYNKIKAKKENVSFSTDIIVGFPNETEEQFQDTLKIAEYCKFDNAFTFVFSARKGTPAAKMEDCIDIETKKERLQRLNQVVNKYMSMQNLRFEQKIVSVLVDGPSKKNSEILSGYTEHNKLVNFKGDKSLIGKIVDVRIVEAKTWSLQGELV
ncbi:tRNA-2-methylthio-N6-dimethylallyladenosine synthase [Bacilli bacterium PM5-3]|nr:tRNA-2-methylthio-N6-dimethylallyladenosine synthase [Bacilli bacterium PM5-3]MDH6604101.1 tRNA-2-methylthio-N6-dimethylallyladenosine synthase [Bacilli bacterium PM5-9]